MAEAHLRGDDDLRARRERRSVEDVVVAVGRAILQRAVRVRDLADRIERAHHLLGRDARAELDDVREERLVRRPR